jgi:hypothetical protein
MTRTLVLRANGNVLGYRHGEQFDIDDDDPNIETIRAYVAGQHLTVVGVIGAEDDPAATLAAVADEMGGQAPVAPGDLAEVPNVDQLRKLAGELGVDVKGLRGRGAIEQAIIAGTASSDTEPPADGDGEDPDADQSGD